MPGKLFDIALKFSKLDENEILRKIWSDTEVQDFIIKLNTIDQLRLGNLANGGEMPEAGPNYLAAKRSLKGSFVGPTSKVSLLLNKDFYRSWQVIPNSIGFLIDANTTIHGRDFIKIYGLDILGLNDENTEKLSEFIKEKIIEEIRSILD